jgi:release factor glutamine methyltransferase
MYTVGEMFSKFSGRLSQIYESHEAENISVLIFEDVLNYGRMKIIVNEKQLISESQQRTFESYLSCLMENKPVQYVLGYAWFDGMKIGVNESVLIPRKETEELVHLILNEIKLTRKEPGLVLDICTGSGCIALALKRALVNTKIIGIDISEDALNVAKANAEKENLQIDFIKSDALKLDLNLHPDVIVSNPPYVLRKEKEQMHKRVLDYEPGLALFVPDDDALLFYRQISSWGFKNLNNGGKIYFEINEKMGKQISELHLQLGFDRMTVKKDMQEKDRMFIAQKP